MNFQVDSEKQRFDIQVACILAFFGFSLEIHNELRTNAFFSDNFKPSIDDRALVFYLCFYKSIINQIIDKNEYHVPFHGYALNKELSEYCQKVQSIRSLSSSEEVTAGMTPSGYKASYDNFWGEKAKGSPQKKVLADKFSETMLNNVFTLAFNNSSILSTPVNNLSYLRNHCSDFANPLTEERVSYNFEKINKISNELDIKNNNLSPFFSEYPDKTISEIIEIDVTAKHLYEDIEDFKNSNHLIVPTIEYAVFLGSLFIQITPTTAWSSYFANESEENLRAIVVNQSNLASISKMTLDFISSDNRMDRDASINLLMGEYAKINSQ